MFKCSLNFAEEHKNKKGGSLVQLCCVACRIGMKVLQRLRAPSYRRAAVCLKVTKEKHAIVKSAAFQLDKEEEHFIFYRVIKTQRACGSAPSLSGELQRLRFDRELSCIADTLQWSYDSNLSAGSCWRKTTVSARGPSRSPSCGAEGNLNVFFSPTISSTHCFKWSDSDGKIMACARWQWADLRATCLPRKIPGNVFFFHLKKK